MSGTVTEDGTGTPLGNIAVTVYRDGVNVRTVRTAADGTYTIKSLDPTGTTIARFRDTDDNSHGDEYFDDTPLAVTATPLALTAGTTTTADAALTPTPALPSLSGTVAEDGTATPLAGIEVRLYTAGHTYQVTTTDGTGHYSLTDLHSGTYTLRYYDPGATHRYEFFDNQTGPGTATPLVLTTGPTTADASLALS